METGQQPSSGYRGYIEKRGFGWLLEVEDDDDQETRKPLLEELDINPTDITRRLKLVLAPRHTDRALLLEEPDFWGPLLVVSIYAMLSLPGQLRVLSWIITIWFAGSLIIFTLARLLGGDLYYSQTLGVLGYCLLPLCLATALSPLLATLGPLFTLIKAAAVVWCSASAGLLLCGADLQTKRPLLAYPIFLLYCYFLSLYTGV